MALHPLAGHDEVLQAFASLLSSAATYKDGTLTHLPGPVNGLGGGRHPATMAGLFASEVVEGASNAWWLASVPSLDLRNRAADLGGVLIREGGSLTPAVSAAVKLAKPLRSHAAGEAGAGDASLPGLASKILANLLESYKSLLTSRLRSSLAALLKKTLSPQGGRAGAAGGGAGGRRRPMRVADADADVGAARSFVMELNALLSRPDAVVVTTAVSSFRAIPMAPAERLEPEETGYLGSRSAALVLEAVLDVSVMGTRTRAVISAPGSITGHFVVSHVSPPRLGRAEVKVDIPHLLKEMMENACAAVRKTLASRARAATATNANCDPDPTWGMAVPYRGMDRSHPSLTSLSEDVRNSSFSKTLPVPTPERRKALYSPASDVPSTASVGSNPTGREADDEASRSGSSVDLAMPPPRPRSPLSMSRSSSRLLFHTGRRTSSQFLADGTLPSVSAESTSVALAQRRNASWDNVVDPSSGMGRLARPSANPAAASSGFAMLSGSRSGLSRSSESSSSRLHEHPKRKIGKKRDRRSHPDGLEKKRRVNTVSDITS
jgi:hypothetical protein